MKMMGKSIRQILVNHEKLDIYLLVKHQVQMQFLLKSIKLVDFQWQKN